MNKSEHPVIENQEEYEAERKLIEFHKGLTEEQKQKFDDLIDILNDLLVQNKEQFKGDILRLSQLYHIWYYIKAL